MTRNQRLAAVVLIRWAPVAWASRDGFSAFQAATEGRWLLAIWHSVIPVAWLASINARRAYYRLIDSIDEAINDAQRSGGKR